MTLCSYANDGFYDEIIDADSRPRSGSAALIQRIAALEEGAIRANPRQYITQPALSLSRAPIIVDEHLEGRHLDVKYFILLPALSDVGTPVDDAIYDTFFALHPLSDKAHTACDPLPRATQTQTQTVEPKPRGA